MRKTPTEDDTYKKHDLKIVIIGNYLPRQCGIATFTTDLSHAISEQLTEKTNIESIAMDDTIKGYKYPKNVKFRIRQNVQADYYAAADYINAKQYDIAILQHEFGIFGGEDGSYILQLLKSLRIPIITNLHTVLKDPTKEQLAIIKGLAKYSSKLLVMSKKAFQLLEKSHDIEQNKIKFIPHGIHKMPFVRPGKFNEQFGVQKNKNIILTFGLLGPDKNLETMIKAMPKIIKKHPNTVYVILGQTHPHILDAHGDSYRNTLQQLVHKLDMDKYIVFHNKFVETETLIKYLQTTKIYAIPYAKKEQITSGTLSYAVGSGRLIVSTPFWHATEILANERGILVPFHDSNEFAKQINKVLSDKDLYQKISKKAYQFGLSMTWEEVAKEHLNLIHDIRENFQATRVKEKIIKEQKIINKLPEINLQHLQSLTDNLGIFQHAKYTIPNYEHGYCIDDNARALIASNIYYSIRKDKAILPFINKYLAFILYAFNIKTGRFRNFMSFNRVWLEENGSEDSHARTIMALGNIIKDPPNKSIKNLAVQIFLNALPVLPEFKYPRAWAFAIVGMQDYLAKYGGDTFVRNLRNLLAKKLLNMFAHANNEWPWLKDKVTYANAIIPHALIMAGQWVPSRKMYSTGIKALEWLLKIQTAKQGHLSIIGNKNWYKKGGKKSHFAQQPIEAMTLLNASLETYITTKKTKWFKEAEKCFRWFLGENDLNIPVFDFETGGSRDGLESYELNANQGAESTLSWLISLLNMHKTVDRQIEDKELR